MKLRHGPVVVQQIRESERHTYATDAGHEFRFTHLKETTIRFHFKRFDHFKPIAEHKHLHQDFITHDLLYEVFPKYSQEVEVSIIWGSHTLFIVLHVLYFESCSFLHSHAGCIFTY